MTTTSSAVEFAAGKGHPDYPLLHRTYSPASRVPCVDFSRWISDRIAHGDVEAVIAYFLQIVQANPGVGVGVEVDPNGGMATREIPKSSPLWVSPWAKDARLVLNQSVDDLVGEHAEWELDLRTALVMLLPKENPLSLLSLRNPPEVLAAIMAPHDVRLRDPHAVARAVNQKLHRERRLELGLGTEEIPDITADELVIGAAESPAPPALRHLPLATRSHLLDISARSRHERPGIAGQFSTFYRTRSIGCDDDQSLAALLDGGLVRVVDDAEVVWMTKATSLTANQLRDLLAEAAIHHPIRATKARLIDLARPIADQVLSAAGDTSVIELTREGQRAANWIAARVNSTARMWGAWAALGDRTRSA